MRKWTRRIVPFALAALGLAVGGLGAPFVPAKAALPEEAMSLAGISALKLQPLAVPSELEAAGLGAAQIETVLRERLDGEGIGLADDPELPQLAVTILVATDQDQPEAMATTVILSVHQRVQIERLDRAMLVPTATLGDTVLTTRRELASSFRDQLRANARALLNFIQGASRPTASP